MTEQAEFGLKLIMINIQPIALRPENRGLFYFTNVKRDLRVRKSLCPIGLDLLRLRRGYVP